MNVSNLGDNLHRGVKIAVDSGEATSIAEAERLFAKYRLMIIVGPDVATSPTLQAALLTAVNTARRCCLGGVYVSGKLDADLLLPWKHCRTMGEAIIDLQGHIVNAPLPEVPRLIIGDVREAQGIGDFVVQATFNGWSGGIIPLGETRRLSEQQEFIPAGVLAGALGVSETFQFLRGNILAGRRDVGLSLWQPEPKISWLSAEPGPVLELLPSRLWVIGLGHLGQAYLWLLGLLPYANPKDVQLVLQDYDTLVRANDSTSLLTNVSLLDQKKTRAMAQWCEDRGFSTAIQERYFSDNFTVSPDEPQVALCGVDNMAARSALEGVGFKRIIEAGLGRGPRGFLTFRTHSFPASRSSQAIWSGDEQASTADDLTGHPAYQALLAKGLDECGLTLLADRTVGAPFVGAVTAAIVISDLLRMVIGEHRYEVIDGDLGSLAHREVVRSDQDWAPFNVGYTQARRN
ncbi:MAG: thiamine biosynthesis protein ThiF [Anaerolineae bacterium]|nr:thiamine biosynthesis protein ThiF [Anaerolineae bacterium]